MMALIDELDFQFLDEGHLLGNENGFVFDIDNIFEDNPVNGKDLNLATTIEKDFDTLACASTDAQGCLIKCQKSPWHESDSGMSEVSYLGSPQSNSEGDNAEIDTSAYHTQEKSMTQLLVNVRDTDIDSDQFSPSTNSGSCTSNISTSATTQNRTESEIVDIEEADPDAFTFFASSKLFSVPKVSVLSSKSEAAEVDFRSKKNAIQAKINREKKKAYIKSLEDEVKELKVDNAKLNSENSKMQTSVKDLEEEVAYLKSVLVNASSLSSLLKNIPQVKEVKLSATVVGRKRSIGADHSYNLCESVAAKRQRTIDENLKKAGVCLHVTEGSACLEFCAHCSRLAQKSSSS